MWWQTTCSGQWNIRNDVCLFWFLKFPLALDLTISPSLCNATASILEWWCKTVSLGLWVTKVKSLSHVQLFATPWTVAYQAPPSMGHMFCSGVGCHFLLQRTFPTQGSNPGLLHCRQTLYCLSHQGSPTSTGSLKKHESSRRTSTFALLTMPKPLTVWITINCGKLFKRWEYQTTWPASWYASQEATVRTGHGITDLFQIEKGVRQGCILLACLFNFYAEYIMRNPGLDETQAVVEIAGRDINNLRYADDTTLMAESEEELKSFLRNVKEQSEKLA